MQPRHVPIALIVAAIWGFNFVVIDAGVEAFPPLLFAALRFLITAVPLVFFVPRPRVPWYWFVIVGMLLGTGQFAFLFISIDHGMPAGLASLVLQTQVLFTVLVAGALLRERLRLIQWLGMLVALAGLTIIGADFGQTSPVAAFVLCLLAALMFGLGNVAMRRMNQAASEPVDTFRFMIWMSLVPPAPLFALSVVFEGTDAGASALTHIEWKGIGALIYIAYLSTVVGFGLWGWLIHRYNAGTVAMYALLIPPIGMGSAAVFLHEELSSVRLLASGLVILGVGIASIRSKRIRGAVKGPQPASVLVPSRDG